MRKLRLPLVALFAAAIAFTSCEDNGDGHKDPGGDKYTVVDIDFQDITLPTAGYELKADNAYNAGGFAFSYSYEYIAEWDWISWSGFVVSNNKDKTTAGATNQFSVYGNGGADGSTQFALVYVSGEGVTEMTYGNSALAEIDYIYVNNSTYAALSIKNGDTMATPFGEDDYFKLTVTGYNTTGTKTGSVDFYLADYRDGKTFICEAWTKIDLQPLGSVNKVRFELETTKKNTDGPLTPSYFCLDNIGVRRYTVD